jgi:hypothetical protein
MAKKKRKVLGKKAVPYLYFGAINKTTFYFIYLGWWTFLGVLAVYSYITYGNLPLDEIELANRTNLAISMQAEEEIRLLKLQIAVLEQELRNLGVILENQTSDDFLKEKNAKDLETFLSLTIFFSIVIVHLYI